MFSDRFFRCKENEILCQITAQALTTRKKIVFVKNLQITPSSFVLVLKIYVILASNSEIA